MRRSLKAARTAISATASVDLVVGDRERRCRGAAPSVSPRSSPGRARGRRRLHRRASPPSSSAASSSPRPRTAATPGTGGERRPSLPALAGGQRRRVDAAHLRYHCQHRRGGDRRAAVRAAVVTRLEHGGDLTPGPARADRHAVAHRLGQRDDVRRDTSCWKPNHSPVRPNPVWISSTIITPRCRRTASRMPARYPAGAGLTPPSP